MRSNQFINLGIGLLALAFVQCGGSKTPEPTAPTPPPETTEPADMTPAAGTMAPEPTPPAATPPPVEEAAPPPKAETIKDPQILSIVSAANQAEIEQAKVAQKKAKNARVKKFAAMMIQHHGDAQKKQEKVAKKLAVSPADSGILTELKTGADSSMEKINAATGADFDSAYIDTQVTEHQQLLDAIDNKLMSQAESADVKTLLTDIRPVVEKHLTEAKDIQQALASGGGAAAAGAPPKAGATGSMPATPKK